MSGPNQEIWWTLIIGTSALLTLGIVFVANIVLSQRRFVTVERQRLEGLQQREQRFRSLTENSFDAIVLITPEGRIVYASQSTTRVLGYSAEELLALSPPELVDARDLDEWKKLYMVHWQTPGALVALQFRARHKNGTWRWVEGVATNLIMEAEVNGVVINYHDITERKRAEERLRGSHDQLRTLSAHLQSVREEERRDIAREIHDELGQMLTVLKMDLTLLERKLPYNGASSTRGEAVQQIQSMADMIDSIIRSVRRIATELRPEVLDELGLKDALEWEVEMFQTRTGIRTKLDSNVGELDLGRERSTALFRIFQETLTNVARHASATEVRASLDQHENTLTLEVQDNGRGITEQEIGAVKSLGLLGMRERALIMGGEVLIEGAQGHGTIVRIQIPYPGPSVRVQ